jgi:hypothetical protein
MVCAIAGRREFSDSTIQELARSSVATITALSGFQSTRALEKDHDESGQGFRTTADAPFGPTVGDGRGGIRLITS